jgi:uncharacterized protein (DUF1810 family)
LREKVHVSVGNRAETGDRFDLDRFTSAQEDVYETVLDELRAGEKRTHWIWFIFPQLDGLGRSPASKYYAIKSLEEAREYLRHPLLGKRLSECAETLLAVEGRSVSQILGDPDDLKLRSCATLFAEMAGDSDSVFVRILDRYFGGEPDQRTLEIIERLGRNAGAT